MGSGCSDEQAPSPEPRSAEVVKQILTGDIGKDRWGGMKENFAKMNSFFSYFMLPPSCFSLSHVPRSVVPSGPRHVFANVPKQAVCFQMSMTIACLIGSAACDRQDARRPSDQKETATPPAVQANPQPTAAKSPGKVAGEIFGASVSMGNYLFAKQVAEMFVRPWGGADLTESERQAFIWEQLLLHYEAFRRGIAPADTEVEDLVNEFLKGNKQSYTRHDNPDAYRQWVTGEVHESVELFENQMRYVLQIKKLKDSIYAQQQVTITDEELKQEFLTETHHVGGEMVVFDGQTEAETFYERVKDAGGWERMRALGAHPIRPVNLMTLEAYMDLWRIPKEQIYALHAMAIGSVGPPMPFGEQWCVYRLLEKRIGDLNDFLAKRDSCVQQLENRKKYRATLDRIEELKQSAHLKTFTATSN